MKYINHYLSINYVIFLIFAIIFSLVGCKQKPVIHHYIVEQEITESNQPVAAPQSSTSTDSPTDNKLSIPMIATVDSDIVGPQWKAPAHWQPTDLGQLRKGSWMIYNENKSEQAEVTVLVFPGDVGGNFSNVNRWRGQIGLENWTQTQFEENSKSLFIGQFPATYVELNLTSENTPSQKAILGAMVKVNEATWYFKIMGDHLLVKNEQQNFISFLESVQFSQ